MRRVIFLPSLHKAVAVAVDGIPAVTVQTSSNEVILAAEVLHIPKLLKFSGVGDRLMLKNVFRITT